MSILKKRIVLIAAGLVMVFFILPILLFIGRSLHLSFSNPAKREAAVLTEFITDNGYKVLHTYNRSESITVSSPSYEYYIEANEDMSVSRDKLLEFMKAKAYQVEAKEYVYDPQCNAAAGGTFCQQKGYSNESTEFSGLARNNHKPYWVAVGLRDRSKFRAEITSDDFEAQSNDSFYGKHEIASGKSVIAITFRMVE